MTNITTKCRLCEKLCSYQFSKQILGKYDISYFECTHCQSLQTEEPYWLDEAYGEEAEKYDTGKASRTLENFFTLPSLFNLLKIDIIKPSLDWGGGGGLLSMKDTRVKFKLHDIETTGYRTHNRAVQ